jgi:transcriptional regulator with XRE-family HTH domain
MADPAIQPPANDDGVGDIAVIVGENLRRLRTRNGLSLERLAKASGVSRAMLGQIELARSAPTISVLWKIARALDVPFSAFTAPDGNSTTVLRAHRAKWLSSRNGRFSSRALFPFGSSRREEFYELRLTAQTVEEAEAHPAGTIENLVVSKGVLEVVIGSDWHRLDAGDAIYFIADQPHAYRNPSGAETVAFVVMVYPDQQV